MTQHVLVPLMQAKSLLAHLFGGISKDVRSLLDQLASAPHAMQVTMVFVKGQDMKIVLAGNENGDASDGLSYNVWSRRLSVNLLPDNIWISTRECHAVTLNRREKKALMAAVQLYLRAEQVIQ